MDKIIIAGQGIVGQATWEYLNVVAKIPQSQIEFHDPALRSFAKSWSSASWCLICVNTDFDVDQGKNNDSNVFEVINEGREQEFAGVYVLRSTVSLDTVDCLSEALEDRLVVFPEFVREKFWLTDCRDPRIMPIGGERAKDFAKLLDGPKMAQTMTAHEAMAVKLTVNGFLATKVMFFNAVYDLCDRSGLDFDQVRAAVENFPGIGSQHAQVPGPDGQLGYGGKCLPKDARTLAYDLNRRGVDPAVIKAVIEANSKVRDE